MAKLSVVIATRNEEKNIGPCLESIKGIADQIIVVDEYSTDKTREIAKRYGAKVYLEPHHDIFHITKQKALEKASGDWILQLDADEVVTTQLANEVRRLVTRNTQPKKPSKLFIRHQKLIEQRDGKIGKETGEIVAFFVPRRNFFLGKPLVHAGAYPDASIRLVKKDRAHFPAKSVHEIMHVDGEVAWLYNDLEHQDSPTFTRYIERMNRYTDLHARELRQKGVPKNILALISYSFYKPAATFVNLYLRHKGFSDGMRGFIWSLFSSLHYPIAYFKYWQEGKK
ncbi:MAG: glycosyltransferase family 2 protein [Patescibacteria group bacterium]